MNDWPALEILTMEDFETRRHRKLHLAAGGETMPLEITEITKMGQSQRNGGAFSVVFRGPSEPVVDQGVHCLEFEGMKPLEIFLVPVGEDDGGRLYEAVFG
ncbi:hypothetical protein H1W37_13350 [Stappia taiwanensis]|uniref:DUF6916 domain-containing protein n=1 Tax=Stappia taiwanensis TaxID=992267 RepID=A0A838XSC1_9HYPH|nr:hypothetical protein [Stappia taiwanensis]MBA4612647.1 hypothetical protein [Stappia taiwanensis]GGE88775.1 hypothetical protein GCM10007285_15340 [Stappia taiwanensis]